MEWRMACAVSKEKIAYNVIKSDDKEMRFILYAEIGKPPTILTSFGKEYDIDLNALPQYGWFPSISIFSLN